MAKRIYQPKTPDNPKQVLSVRVDAALIAQLEAIAKRERVSRGELVASAVHYAIKRYYAKQGVTP